MAAFERVRSGMEGLDGALDSIRLGDNVVWQVSSVDEYRRVAIPFARQALADGRRLVYVRFAAHPPILAEDPRVETHELDPALGFESFTGEVHRIIAEAGREAFYVFDCLSGLQTAWSADLMMGNFFVVTCPYLFELDTVAFFCLLRREHSYATVARIRETTQILIDLHTDAETLYAHPLKVWKRYSPTMFLPHRLDPESVSVGVDVGDHFLVRPSSSVAKKTDADFRISFARRSSRFSRSSSSTRWTPARLRPSLVSSWMRRSSSMSASL